MNKKGQEGLFLFFVLFFIFMAVVTIFIAYPLLKPWYATQSGKAEFAQAEQNRQITILEANAKKESATLLAQAEIERAKGVAESNKIIGDSLKGNDAYLRYLWIDTLGENDIIYVPTEAGLPILEAGKRQ